jgi:hypothetical protein
MARSFRCAPFPRHCSATFCQPWSLLRKALIRAAKTSPTAERYAAFFLKFIDNELKEYYNKNHIRRAWHENVIFIYKYIYGYFYFL